MNRIRLITSMLLVAFFINAKAQNTDQFGITDHGTKRAQSQKNNQGNLQVPKPPKDNPQARLDFELLKVKNPKTGEIPSRIRERELAFMKSQASQFMGDQLLASPITAWSNRGPFNVGGRTRALEVDVLNPNIILAGGVSGGMWRSTNEGLSWSKTTGSNELQSVTCLAQDRRSGFESIWYYGTGENRGNSAASVGASYLGNGVYKSTDNGLSWTLLESTASNTPQSFENRFDIIHEIAVNPLNGDVYVATYDGLYRSDNGGSSFDRVLGGDLNSTWVDVVVNGSGEVFAVLDGEGIFSSTNGTNWTDITPAGFPLSNGERKEISYAPSNQNILYVLGEDGTHASEHTLWKRDEFEVWEDRSSGIPLLGGQTGDFDSQGSYNLLLTVKDDDPDFVIIGGTNLFRSTDGFSTTNNTTWIGGYTPENASFALYEDHHPDQHSFVFLGGNRALSGNDGGVQLTADIAGNFSATEPVDWTPLNNGYLTTQVYAVSAGPGDQILAGFQDNGTWYTSSTDGTQGWTTPFGGDGAYSAFSSDGTTRYLSSQNGNIYRFEYSSADDETLDNFAFFTPDGYTASLFIVPFYLDPTNDNIFYLAGANDLYVNTSAETGDNLTGWKTISLGGSGIVSEIGVSNDGFVLAGTFSGELFKVSDPAGTHSVTDITGSNFPSGFISGIDVNRFNPDEMIVSFSNYEIPSVFHTSDGGVTWTDVSGSLEENPDGSGSGPSARSVRILGDGVKYFVGTSTGLYATEAFDGANTIWTQENSDGIGDVVVEHLVTKQDGTVIAGTHGNGVFSAQYNLGADVIDMEINYIVRPANVQLGAEEEVEVLVVNQGTVSVSEFDMILRIDGQEIANESVNTEVLPGGLYYHTFGTTVDLSANDSYEFDIELVLATDDVPENNRFIQAVTNTPFVGTYSMEQVALTTTGTSATFGGGTLFSGSGVITVELEFLGTNTRTLKAQYLSQLGFSGDDTFIFDLIEGNVIFLDNQNTGVTCSGNEVFLGTADVPGTFNANDDTSFTLTLKEDQTESCGSAVDVEFTLTRLDGVDVNIADREALIALYNATEGPNWSTTWDISESPLNWEGVVVSAEGRVIDITLPNNNLTGSLPAEIGNLTALVNLVLTGNNLEGSIPSEIGNLADLEVLVIDDMGLSGTVPEGIWNLTKLKRLNLDFNELEGSIPSALGNLINLQRLDLDGNNFSGELPSDISLLTNLTSIDLDFNAFDGSIPSSIGNMTQVTFLDISDNQFIGAVPSNFSALINATFIDISNNELDVLPDLTGIIPATFDVADNNFDFGDVVPNVASLTVYAPQNNLEDEILKPSIGELMTMEAITTDDGSNSYEWLFNESFFTNGTNTIDVTYNSSTEAGIYACLISNPGAPNLVIRKEYTVVDNTVTSHPDYPALEAFYLSTNGSSWTDNSNWLTGSDLSAWFGLSLDGSDRVYSILLGDNNLSGELPPELGDLSALTELVLYINRINGSIPIELGNLTSLTRLDLSFNSFSGEIPNELSDLTLLQIFGLAGNDLTGSLPSDFGNLNSLTTLSLEQNDLSGEIPNVFGSMTDLSTVRLHENEFTGNLPASFNSLSNLVSINVSDNGLTGLPDLNSISSVGITVSDNALDFSDIVPNTTALDLYSPQDNIDETYFEVVNEGGSVTLEVSDQASGNVYVWYLNGDIVNEAIGSSYTISNFDSDHVGLYTCEITNPSAPDLTITRNAITLDINLAPTDIQITNASLQENNESGEVVGTLSTTDADSDTHTFSIASGSDFSIGGSNQDELLANTVFNFESTSSANVEITAEDDLGVSYTKSFTINIEDANDAPTDITLSNNTIDEGEESGTSIGRFTVVDEDASDTHSFTIGGSDSGSFIVGGSASDELQSNEVFDEGTKNSYSIEVTATDGGNAEFTKVFSITIEEVEEEEVLGLDDGDNLVQIYPNPSDGKFHVVLDPSLTDPSWKLTDIGSKEIELKKNIEIQNHTIQFEIGDLGSGVYLLNIESRDKKIIKRIIIE